MVRLVFTFIVGVTLLTVAAASAAHLKVDGGTIQVFTLTFEPPTPTPTPTPAIPAECTGPDWKSATIVFLKPGDSPYEAGNGKHIIIGTDGPDEIHGQNGRDCIFGMGGDDIIYGGNAPDYIDGGDGYDICVPGNGGGAKAVVKNCESDTPAGNKLTTLGAANEPDGSLQGDQPVADDDPAPGGNASTTADGADSRDEAPSPTATATATPTRTPMPTPTPKKGQVRTGGNAGIFIPAETALPEDNSKP